jgi:hypothetical protein
MPTASNSPARACASAPLRPEANARARAGGSDPRVVKAVDKAGFATALWRARYARFAHRHPSGASRHHNPYPGLRRPKTSPPLTKPPSRNIIPAIRGSRPWVADIKSESRPASDRNRWPASFRNAWPASSESATLGFLLPPRPTTVWRRTVSSILFRRARSLRPLR